ncbi:organic solute transporter alpha-like protein [Tribolium madens]|uniref:organic solute transporter alpha-like protein n=1 Tax=Tribolium madens TaxID=41895 RepID=UPI001CF724A1|nr:organic solute transporter alpha-like protein [Tribolium madens]
MDFFNKNRTCALMDIPSIPEYLSATNVYGVTLVTLGTLAVVLVLVMFIDTLRYIIKNSSSRVKTYSAFVIGVYPVVALVTYFAILVPRAHLLSEAITQGAFMAGMYQLFCLFVAYCGGEAELIRKVKPGSLNLRVMPCCCWPCCFFLPPIEVTKNTIQRLRLLVLQLPVVQGLVYLVLLVMWAERESLYQVNYMYLQPVIIISILFGVWGMAMTINLLKGFLGDEYLMPPKFIVLQLVLVLAKMQGAATRGLVWIDILPCRPPITPTVYANLIHNTLMLAEMVLLQFAARKLYKRILPDFTNEGIGTISTIGGIMATMTDNNNSNCENLNVKLGVNKMGHINVALDMRE